MKDAAAFLLPSCLVLSLTIAAAADITASPHSDPVPPVIHSSLASQLKAGGVRASANGVTLDFWWSAGVPLAAGAAGWDAVPEGALIGAVRMDRDFRDIRGRVLKAGVYTLRYGIQPDNGDHLGVSPHRQFLLLSPAADDRNPAPQGHDGTVELSKASVGGSHPGVLSIDPPAAVQQPLLSVHTTDLGHHAVIVEVPASETGKPSGVLKFGVVLIGKIEA
jgi:hypothetical protein